MNRLLLVLAAFLSITLAAQTGKITGKIIDAKTGETLPGATAIIEGTTKGASADFDGNFSINNVPAGKVNLIVSYISYDNKKLTGIEVKANDVTNINIQLETSTSQNLQEVTVTVEIAKENTAALVLMQKNNISVSDGVSAETIKRTPDRNTADVLKRVSGASIQDNKFAIIRGLNERYNAAYLNGAPLPSSESDRKAFSFDVFPSNMLDNLVIIKTARPELPGEFAGGIIEISTKNIPDKTFLSVNISGGYNTITTGKQQIYYQGGKTDWLGMDDGTRSMPSEIPAYENFPLNIHEQAKLAKVVPTSDWNLYEKKFSPNYAFQLSAGHNFKYKERDFFGVLFSMTYNRTNLFSTTERNSYTNNSDPLMPSDKESSYLDKSYSTQILSGAMLNLSCKINENHSISLKNLYSLNSDDKVITREGTPTPLDVNPTIVKSNAMWYTGNKIASSQLVGDHYLPKAKIKINWVGAFSDIKREVPNLRRSIFTRYKYLTDPNYPIAEDTMYQAQISQSSISPDYGGTMFWSKLNENIKSFKADVSRPFSFTEKIKMEVKLGGLVQLRDRTFDVRQVGYTRYKGGNVYFKDSLLYLNQSQLLTAQNMGLMYTDAFSNGAGGFKLIDATKARDSYKASSALQAGYLQLDFKYSTWLRLVGGARLENYTQSLTYNDVAYLVNKKTITKDTTVLDILPSVNLIFSITDKQNIRLCYSKTLNRPEFRELAPFAFYDFNTMFVVTGNDTLKRCTIDNYDLRYEIFPGRGQLFSASGFYKNFTNPIEQVQSNNKNELTYNNVPNAKSYGFELEYRIIIGALFKNDSSWYGKLLNNLTLFTNYAYIKSEVDVSKITNVDYKSRPMQGQSPYILNAGISYVDNDYNFSISGIVNRIGDRISVVGNKLYPDIWEHGRTVLDLQATKSLLKNKIEIRFTIKDVLAQYQYFYNDKNVNRKFDEQSDDIIWKTKFGSTYAFQIGYKF